MVPSGDVAVVIPARNESDRIRATVTGAAGLPGVDLVLVVDDGSRDGTAAAAQDAGASVVRHSRSRGKAAAMESGAEAVRLLEARDQPPAAASSAVPRRRPRPDRRRRGAAGRAGAGGRGRHDDRGLRQPGQAGRPWTRRRALRRRHRAGHRLAAGPAAQRPALPDPGRVRGRPAARARVRRGDGPHDRPAPPRHAGAPRSRYRWRTAPPAPTGGRRSTGPGSSPTSPARWRSVRWQGASPRSGDAGPTAGCAGPTAGCGAQRRDAGA